MEELALSHPTGGKRVWLYLKKLNIQLQFNPAIANLGIYPRETKGYIPAETCI